MDYTYKIENYIPSEKRLFVVYTPDDSSLPPYGNWVAIGEDESEEQILQRVVQCFPIEKWNSPSDPVIENLVGATNANTYTPPVVSTLTISLEETIRRERNIKLQESDWTQLPDAPLTTEQKTQWGTYRQALRDLTEQEGFPSTIVWPQSPNN